MQSGPGIRIKPNRASLQGTYTLCDLSFIHPFGTLTHSFIQQIFINSPRAGLSSCSMLGTQYLHMGWTTFAVREKRLGWLISQSSKEFSKNFRHSHGRCILEGIKKRAGVSESISNRKELRGIPYTVHGGSARSGRLGST